MNEFNESTREHKFRKGATGNEYRRTIRIVASEGNTFVVKIKDSHLENHDGNHGLQDPNKRNVETPNDTTTEKTTPPLTLQAAIAFANEQFTISVKHKHFEPLPIGADFPA